MQDQSVFEVQVLKAEQDNIEIRIWETKAWLVHETTECFLAASAT